MEDNNIVLEVNHLKTSFFYGKKEGKAVDDVSFKVKRGEILGIVGESGSGKSVTAMSIMSLLRNTTGKVMGGDVIFMNQNLLALSDKEMRAIRGKHISMVFQEPMTSLNPVLTVGEQIEETIIQHEKVSKKEAWARAKELLDVVQIPLSEKRLKEYPHQLSGGMRQRVMIAMGLCCNPDLIIADEPTTALDVTIQMQILELFKSLRDKYNMSIILITHDMGVIAEMADNVMVMYAGCMVEYGDTVSVLKNPKHPYTKALMDAIPKLDEKQETLNAIPGVLPGLMNLPEGCRFNPRCKYAADKCRHERPEEYVKEGRTVYCWKVLEEEKEGLLWKNYLK
jgi:oligopeptide/dipeptide ABC transporter ATP-binding protein